MRDHTKLDAFKLADELVLATYRATRLFPDDEKYGLSAQLRRAAVSVATNIVEGSARLGEGEYVHLLSVAYGSAKEVQYQLSVASRLGFVHVDSATELTRLSSRTVMVLSALISSLRPIRRSGGRR